VDAVDRKRRWIGAEEGLAVLGMQDVPQFGFHFDTSSPS